MTCQDIDGVLNSHSVGSLLPRQAIEHIAECGRCRWLVWLLEEVPASHAPSADLLKRIHAAILEGLKPVRPLASARTYFFAFVLVFLAVMSIASVLLGMKGWNAL